MKIGVIGGGFTGLTAAYRLSQKGHDVTILEKTDYLGGLASTFKIQGENLEKAYHHLFRTDTDILSLVNELGLNEKLEWLDSSVSIYYEGKLYPFMTPMDLIKFSPLNLIDRFRAGITVLFLQKYKSWKGFVKISAYSWMNRYAGKNVVKVIWGPLLKGKFDKFYDKVSMAWLWARIHIRANSKAPGDFNEKLGYFKGGFNVIVEELTERLKQNKVKILNGVNISSISNTKDNKVLLNVDAKELTFDKVICSVPNHIFTKLAENNLSEEYISKLNSINYLGAICCIFSSDQNLSKYYWHNINDVTFPFLVFINHTKLTGTERYKRKNIYYIGTYLPHDDEFFTKDENEIKEIWFSYLQKIFPDFDTAKINDQFLFKFKYAQHIVDLSYQSKIPDYTTPLKNVYLSNFSQIFPEDRGTNYAVREGNKIAKLILE